MSDEPDLYLGMKGHIVCINKHNGAEKWRTKLRSGEITTLLVQEDAIYAGVSGYLYALRPSSGEILWKNSMQGLGHGLITIGAD